MKTVKIVMIYKGEIPDSVSLGELREYAEGRIDDFFRYEEYDFDRTQTEITDKGMALILR